MVTLFISPYTPLKQLVEPDDNASFRIDPAIYSQELKKRWHFAKVIDISKHSTYLLSWNLDHENRSGISGGLQSDFVTVDFNSNPHNGAVDFILWHRGFVPSENVLFLFDDNLRIHVQLDAAITETELTALLE